MRTEYPERGRIAADIADDVGCPDKTVDRALRRHGIRRPPHRTLADVLVDWLREQYVRRERSIIDIAAGGRPVEDGRASRSGGGWHPIDNGRLPAELDDPEWLAAQAGVASAGLARRLGVTPEAVSRARQRHGLLAGVVRQSKYRQLDDRSWLEARYVTDGLTQAQIAKVIGCSRSAVTLAMDRLGIQARPTKVPEHPELHDRERLAGQLADGADGELDSPCTRLPPHDRRRCASPAFAG